MPHTALRLSAAYRAGATTPAAEIDRLLAAHQLAERNRPQLRALIRTTAIDARREALAATERYRAGRPLSPLDGVPFVVKDCLDVEGAITTNGSVLPAQSAKRDAAVVAALRNTGAIPVGKANLHEFGSGATGINPHHGTARNPHDLARICGGSSSGSAAAVAAGLVPIAIGTDAGGSVRAPASLCGVVGLKPTFGRASRDGWAVLSHSMDHVGLLTQSCEDAALTLAALAPGPLAADEETWDADELDINQVLTQVRQPVDRLRIGFDPALFSHPLVDPAIARLHEQALAQLSTLGVAVREVSLPDPDFARLVGLMVMGGEGASAFRDRFGAAALAFLGADLQLLLGTSINLTAHDYLHAQRLRSEIRKNYLTLLSDTGGGCDVILMPASGVIAPFIRPDSLRFGEVDDAITRQLISHTFSGNLTGLPAVSVPCGSVSGMPVGLQLVGRPWEELTILSLGHAFEQQMEPSTRWVKPKMWLGPEVGVIA